jgi:hypothetical protein
MISRLLQDKIGKDENLGETILDVRKIVKMVRKKHFLILKILPIFRELVAAFLQGQIFNEISYQFFIEMKSTSYRCHYLIFLIENYIFIGRLPLSSQYETVLRIRIRLFLEAGSGSVSE